MSWIWSKSKCKPGLLGTPYCSYPGEMAGAGRGANNLSHLDEIAITSVSMGCGCPRSHCAGPTLVGQLEVGQSWGVGCLGGCRELVGARDLKLLKWPYQAIQRAWTLFSPVQSRWKGNINISLPTPLALETLLQFSHNLADALRLVNTFPLLIIQLPFKLLAFLFVCLGFFLGGVVFLLCSRLVHPSLISLPTAGPSIRGQGSIFAVSPSLLQFSIWFFYLLLLLCRSYQPSFLLHKELIYM